MFPTKYLIRTENSILTTQFCYVLYIANFSNSLPSCLPMETIFLDILVCFLSFKLNCIEVALPTHPHQACAGRLGRHMR